jgi:hypothetical protein
MLPTIDEFRADHELCMKQVHRAVILAIGSLGVFLVLGIAARSATSPFFGAVPAEFVPATCVALGLPLMLFGFWRADQYQKHYPNLHCRHCNKPLLQSARIVIASRNCPSCGRQVLSPLEEVD